MRRTIPLLIAGLLTGACQDFAVDSSGADGGVAIEPQSAVLARAGAPAADGAEIASAPANARTVDPMLIRTGEARIEVDSIEAAVERVRAIATSAGGTLLNSTVQSGERQARSASITLRVPADRFDEAMRGLEPIGRVASMNVQGVDVGEEYVDVSARLVAARQLEQRLLEILRTRTGRLDEVLAVERELARIRAEIEGYEGRLRYLRDRVALSHVTAHLYEPSPIVASLSVDDALATAARQAWRNFIGLVVVAIEALGLLLPLATAAALVWLVVRRRVVQRPAA